MHKKDFELLKKYDDGKALLRVPRYTAFTKTATKFAKQNINFIEIAGNKSAILISVLAGQNALFDQENTRRLFAQKLSTDKDRQRIVLVTPIAKLAQFLRDAEKNDLTVEHVYDF